MVLRKIMGIFACTLIIGAASFAMAGVPDLQKSQASSAYGGLFVPVLHNLPNGGGASFTGAVEWDGVTTGTGTATVDVTITITLIDGGDAVVTNFPAEDLWLESNDGGMVFCPSGTIADADTDLAGSTQWQNPLLAGAASEDVTLVIVNGAALTSNTGIALKHNSADLNGDLAVNLSDVPVFAGDFYSGGYVFRADLKYDGAVNLSDVVILAQGQGALCP